MRVSWSMIAVIALSVGTVSISSTHLGNHFQSLAESDKKDDDKDDEEDGRASLKKSFADDCLELLVESGKKDDEEGDEITGLNSSELTGDSQKFLASGRKDNKRRKGPSVEALV